MTRACKRFLAMALATTALPTTESRAQHEIAADADALDRIVVTAQKREQAAQEAAVALSVLDGATLRARGIERLSDVQYAVPSLEVEPAFGTEQPYFRLRGVGFVDYMSNNTSPVGVSLDGVAYAFPIQTQGFLFDLDRVEVLRGPQGTLYGRNSTAGAINFVAKGPTAEFDAGVQVQSGSNNGHDTEAFVSGPMGEGIRGRLAVARASGGAWQRHRDTGEALGDRDVRALRAKLEADLGDNWQTRLDLNYGVDRSDTLGLQLLSDFTPAAGGATVAADSDRRATGWALRPDYAARIGLDPDAKPGRDNRNEGAALTVLGGSESLSFTSISAFNRLSRREYADFDATPRAESDQFFDSRIRSASQELRLQSSSERALVWTAGLYAARERLDEASHVDLSERLIGELLTEYRQVSDTVGAFGQLDWHFAPDWNLGLGVRRDRERRELSDFHTRFVSPEIALVGPVRRELTHSGNSGRLALEWRTTADTLWYVSLGRGVKSGGFTAHNSVDAATLEPFKPEDLIAWEAGLKADLGDTLRLNAALFHYDYRDQQVLSAYFEPLSQALIGLFVNAPRSRIQGGEVELEWKPAGSFSFGGFVGYKRGRYTDSFVTFDPVASLDAGANVFSDYDGEALDFPRLSAGLRGRWSMETARGRVELDAGAAYRSRYEQTLLLGRGFGLDAYWLAQAGIRYTPRAARWSVGLQADNLFDTDYDRTRNYYLPGTQVVARGEPRRLSLRWDWRY